MAEPPTTYPAFSMQYPTNTQILSSCIGQQPHALKPTMLIAANYTKSTHKQVQKTNYSTADSVLQKLLWPLPTATGNI